MFPLKVLSVFRTFLPARRQYSRLSFLVNILPTKNHVKWTVTVTRTRVKLNVAYHQVPELRSATAPKKDGRLSDGLLLNRLAMHAFLARVERVVNAPRLVHTGRMVNAARIDVAVPLLRTAL